MSEWYETFDVVIEHLGSFSTSKKLIDYIKTSEHQEKEHWKRFSKKKPLGSEFLRRIYGEPDPLALVIKAHLFLENFLNDIIRKKFKDSKKILDLKFYTKLNILKSKNYVDEKLYNDIKVFNELRNKYGHYLFYDISLFQMNRFTYCSNLYDLVNAKGKKARSTLNVYILRNVLYALLIRLTKKYPFLGELKTETYLNYR